MEITASDWVHEIRVDFLEDSCQTVRRKDSLID